MCHQSSVSCLWDIYNDNDDDDDDDEEEDDDEDEHDDVIKLKHFPRYWPFVRGIPSQRARDAELRCFLWSAPEQMVEQTIETLVIWDAIALIMTSLEWGLGQRQQ